MKNNLYLAQKQFSDAVRSLHKSKKKLLARALLVMVADFQQYSVDYLKIKYHLGGEE